MFYEEFHYTESVEKYEDFRYAESIETIETDLLDEILAYLPQDYRVATDSFIIFLVVRQKLRWVTHSEVQYGLTKLHQQGVVKSRNCGPLILYWQQPKPAQLAPSIPNQVGPIAID